MFGEVTMFLKAWSYGSMLKICAPKTYELQLLQGNYTLKNILLDFYITEISFLSEYSQKLSSTLKQPQTDVL